MKLERRVVSSGDGITLTAVSVDPETRALLSTGSARLPPLRRKGEPARWLAVAVLLLWVGALVGYLFCA